jgi:predicted nucleic acid-binding protein
MEKYPGNGMIYMNDNNDLEFIDTNVLVYAYDPTAEEKYQIARKLISQLWESKRGCLSIQILQEFFVISTSPHKKSIHSSEEVANVIRDLGTWKTFSPKTEDVLSAIAIKQKYQISFWDAMVIHSARSTGCRILWSEDLNEQNYFGVEVKNPFK